MKVVIQRVSEARLTIDGTVYSEIGAGMVILLGISVDDTAEDMDYLLKKIPKLRIFDDESGVMNLDITQTDPSGDILLVSQFTLFADTRKGNRPSYIGAARPEQAIPLYEQMVEKLSESLGKRVQTGKFGADMKVALVNDGPVTIIIDSKNR
ncbi:D-tyrosyl-tRNA(Tyr) deacylase [Porphyromonas cangingivalis]|uniref:D-aminoacyl-tRNA deacylase n=1 Tax=Porphyromonas cangingivalis TaxID=36874 RepID=A0A0A2F3A3_PORCN|nr:D-aminoacyl-tRNA deacylase [Porphyromonas cangingivalis]KGN82919.1 D-tyrosyl-tRNA(Tyr) deacylase [Porphyromonas cangingivalis]